MKLYPVLAALLIVLAFGCGSDEAPKLSGDDDWTSSFSDPENNEAPDPDPDPDPVVIPDPRPELAPNGAPCTQDDQCNGGTCLTSPEFLDGFCTENNCGRACATEGECVDYPLGNFCAPTCSADAECREGYVCGQVDGASQAVCTPVFGLPDGEPCAQDSECQGGTCITDWPGGYCTTVDCENFEDCARQGFDNKCLQNPRGPNICVRICQEDSECRDGYLCERFGPEGLCSPDPSVPIDPSVLQNLPFETTCVSSPDGAIVYDFDVTPGTTSYMVTPLNLDGRSLNPLSIDLPDGRSVDFGGQNRFQAVNASFYAMNPTVIPGTPEFTGQLMSGAHTYRLSSQSEETCFYQIEESTAGSTIDINFYFVGIGGLTSMTAQQHPDFQASLAKFDEVYGAVGLQRGVTRYFDITGDDESAYSVVRSEGDIGELVALSQQPGPSKDDVLSVNVFFVRAFAINGGAIGISSGLPGPAGLHGTLGSGVVFTSEFLGVFGNDRFGNPVDGNAITAQVMAHEIGHYLGLFHTTESDGRTHDPLVDTPECDGIGFDCPDITNLMFPSAGEDHLIITPDQTFVFETNPLTKEVSP